MPQKKVNGFEWFTAIRKVHLLESSIFAFSLVFNLASLSGVGFLFYRYLHGNGLAWQGSHISLFLAVVGILVLNAILSGGSFYLRGVKGKLESKFYREGHRPIYDQAALREILRHEIKRAGRYHLPATLCLIDIDDTESLAHKQEGGSTDKIYETFGSLVAGIIRSSDYLGRFENNQFCVLLCHTPLAHAQNFIYRLLVQSQERMELSFSSGFTSYRAGEDAKEFFERGKRALLSARHEGVKKTHCSIGKDDQQVIRTF